jgi:hypothetical protein
MKTKLKPFVLGVFVAGIFVAPMHAQTAPSAPTGNRATPANAAPAGQAPDDATRKITELVHDGKYAEAQRLTTALLVAYPDDQRLIKAKAMLEKLLAASGSATTVPNSNQSPNSSVPAHTTTEQLTGMDKVDYNALIELVRQAQQSTDLPQQTTLLTQYMDQSALFLQKHPEQMLLWQLRAVSAISLNSPLAGFEAAQKLLAAGAADSNDPKLQQLLAKLKLLGWMNKQQAEALQLTADHEREQRAESAKKEQLEAEHDQYTFPVAHAHFMGYGWGHMTVNENDAVYVAPDETIHLSKNDIREMKAYCLSKSVCGMYFYPKNGGKFFFLAVTEDAVANRNIEGSLPPSVLGNAAVARWKFVSIDHKTLGPSPAAQNSAP